MILVIFAWGAARFCKINFWLENLMHSPAVSEQTLWGPLSFTFSVFSSPNTRFRWQLMFSSFSSMSASSLCCYYALLNLLLPLSFSSSRQPLRTSVLFSMYFIIASAYLNLLRSRDWRSWLWTIFLSVSISISCIRDWVGFSGCWHSYASFEHRIGDKLQPGYRHTFYRGCFEFSHI